LRGRIISEGASRDAQGKTIPNIMISTSYKESRPPMRDNNFAALADAENRTRERHERAELRKKKRGYTFGALAEGELLNEALLAPLTTYMSTPASRPRNKDLWDVVRQLTPQQRAFIALSAVAHYIATADDSDPEADDDDDQGDIFDRILKCRLKIGRAIYAEVEACQLLKGLRGRERERERKRQRRLRKFKETDWPDPELAEAGEWATDVVCEALSDHFCLPRHLRGIPCVTKAAEYLACALVEALVLRRPIFVPVVGEIKDWTDWRCGGCWNDGSKIAATFVRGPRPWVRNSFKRIFREGTIPHVKGVNVLQRVQFVINDEVLPVVKQFARKLGKVDKFRFTRDIAIAESLIGKTWHVPLNCDFRGRVYGVSDFNFYREDHVRSLFRFANSMAIGEIGLRWLMIHTANTYGGPKKVDKKPLHERYQWVEAHREQIERVAKNPYTEKWWKNADSPFQFLAACLELTAAWKAGHEFQTSLPICIDASCSGIQHFAMMMRDEDAGRHVNLMPSGKVEDIYYGGKDIYQHAAETIEEQLSSVADEDAKASWWLNRGIDRKLVKPPVMSFGYSVSIDGMTRQIEKAEPAGDGFYLARHCMEACKKILPGPTAAMEFICGLAEEACDRGVALELTMPSGFPWTSAYYKSNIVRVELYSRNERARIKVGDGFTSEIRRGKSKNAAAPNFVHAWDAVHLVFSALALAEAGITNVVSVHDCFAFLAPQVAAGGMIVLDEFAKLYADRDPLAELRNAVGSARPVPPKGALDPHAVRRSVYAFS